MLERFPIQNTSEWEVDKTSNRYPMIVSTIAEPKCDPWNRPTLPWNFNQGDLTNIGHMVQWILKITLIFVIQQSIKSQSSYGRRRSKRS